MATAHSTSTQTIPRNDLQIRAAFWSIRSLELVAFTMRPGSTLTHAIDIIKMVPSTFPTLQHLYIAFGRGLYDTRTHGRKQTWLEFSKDMLPVIDEFVRRYAPGSLQLEVGIPTSVFHASWCIEIGSRLRFQAPNWKPVLGPLREVGGFCERKRIWRTVYAMEDGKDGQPGYGLSETDSNMPNGWMVSMARY